MSKRSKAPRSSRANRNGNGRGTAPIDPVQQAAMVGAVLEQRLVWDKKGKHVVGLAPEVDPDIRPLDEVLGELADAMPTPRKRAAAKRAEPRVKADGLTTVGKAPKRQPRKVTADTVQRRTDEEKAAARSASARKAAATRKANKAAAEVIAEPVAEPVAN